MSDKEALVISVLNYSSSVTKQIFGVNLGVAGKAIAKLMVDNYLKKSNIGNVIGYLFDEDDNLPDPKEFFEAVREIVKQKPLVIKNVKFTVEDIDEIEKLFNKR